jgi:hypothetical protein
MIVGIAGLAVLMLTPMLAVAQAPSGPGWGDGGGQGRGQRPQQRQMQRQQQRPELRFVQVQIVGIDTSEMLIELKGVKGERQGVVQYHERTRFVLDGEKADVSGFSSGDEVWVALIPPRGFGENFHLAFMGDERPQRRQGQRPGGQGGQGGQGQRGGRDGQRLREMMKPVEVQVVGIDESAGTVTLQAEDGWSWTYQVPERARLFLDGEKAELGDFSRGTYFALAPGMKHEKARERVENAERDVPLGLLCDEESLQMIKKRLRQRDGTGGQDRNRDRVHRDRDFGGPQRW